MKEKVYHIATQEDCNALMEELEEQGYVWWDRHKPATKVDFWWAHKKDTCVKLEENKNLSCGDYNTYKALGYAITEYKAPRKKIVYHTPTQEDYKGLLIELEEKGYVWWSSEEKPTKSLHRWKIHKKETCVCLHEDKTLTYGNYQYFKEEKECYIITEYKAPKKETVYHTPTQEDYDVLMEDLEEKGYTWNMGGNVTDYLYIWEDKKEETCIHLREDKTITFCDICYFKNKGYTITEYKAPQKEKREMKEKVYHTKTQEDFNALVKELEEQEYAWWWSAKNPTGILDRWEEHKEKTCVHLREEKTLIHAPYSFYQRRGYEITEYKAPRKKIVYHTKTQEDFNALMQELEEQGYTWWVGGKKPTYCPSFWKMYKKETCVRLCKDNYLTHAPYDVSKLCGCKIIEYPKPSISFQEFFRFSVQEAEKEKKDPCFYTEGMQHKYRVYEDFCKLEKQLQDKKVQIEKDWEQVVADEYQALSTAYHLIHSKKGKTNL